MGEVMTNVAILEMHENHVDTVVAIDAQTNNNPWSGSTFIKEINSPTHILLVAIDDNGDVIHDDVKGFSGGQLIGNEFHIHSLAVNSGFRRQGIGRRLIKELLDDAKERDANSATLEVRVSNEAAISLYESLGFVSEGVRPKYYADNGEDALIMWLRNY